MAMVVCGSLALSSTRLLEAPYGGVALLWLRWTESVALEGVGGCGWRRRDPSALEVGRERRRLLNGQLLRLRLTTHSHCGAFAPCRRRWFLRSRT